MIGVMKTKTAKAAKSAKKSTTKTKAAALAIVLSMGVLTKYLTVWLRNKKLPPSCQLPAIRPKKLS